MAFLNSTQLEWLRSRWDCVTRIVVVPLISSIANSRYSEFRLSACFTVNSLIIELDHFEIIFQHHIKLANRLSGWVHGSKTPLESIKTRVELLNLFEIRHVHNSCCIRIQIDQFWHSLGTTTLWVFYLHKLVRLSYGLLELHLSCVIGLVAASLTPSKLLG
jgi:hypothetical protein